MENVHLGDERRMERLEMGRRAGLIRPRPPLGERRLLPLSGRKAVRHSDAELSASVAWLLGGGRAEGPAPFW